MSFSQESSRENSLENSLNFSDSFEDRGELMASGLSLRHQEDLISEQVYNELKEQLEVPEELKSGKSGNTDEFWSHFLLNVRFNPTNDDIQLAPSSILTFNNVRKANDVAMNTKEADETSFDGNKIIELVVSFDEDEDGKDCEPYQKPNQIDSFKTADEDEEVPGNQLALELRKSPISAQKVLNEIIKNYKSTITEINSTPLLPQAGPVDFFAKHLDEPDLEETAEEEEEVTLRPRPRDDTTKLTIDDLKNIFESDSDEIETTTLPSFKTPSLSENSKKVRKNDVKSKAEFSTNIISRIIHGHKQIVVEENKENVETVSEKKTEIRTEKQTKMLSSILQLRMMKMSTTVYEKTPERKNPQYQITEILSSSSAAPQKVQNSETTRKTVTFKEISNAPQPKPKTNMNHISKKFKMEVSRKPCKPKKYVQSKLDFSMASNSSVKTNNLTIQLKPKNKNNLLERTVIDDDHEERAKKGMEELQKRNFDGFYRAKFCD
jgi:hypothetical protein